MNSGFRRMENVFQSGEVTGTAAAMAVRQNRVPRAVPVADLQAELRRRGFMTSQKDRLERRKQS
jgi:hypothetical protein